MMKIYLMVLIILCLNCVNAMAQSVAQNSAFRTVNCTARDVHPPPTESPITIKISGGEDPLVISSSLKNRELNFRIGQGNVAGGKVDSTRHEGFGFKCRSMVKDETGYYSFDYICEQFITNSDGSTRTIQTLTSQLKFRNGDGGLICKSIDRVSPCWNLTNCK